MSDKHEQAENKTVRELLELAVAYKTSVTLDWEEAQTLLASPEPVKLESVRELVEKIKEQEWSRGCHMGDLRDHDECERLITDFIQTREAGKSCEGCLYDNGSITRYECHHCKRSELATDNYLALPPAPKE